MHDNDSNAAQKTPLIVRCAVDKFNADLSARNHF